jgi:hypothetical protein
VTVAFQFFFCFWLQGLTGNHPISPLLFGLVFVAIPVSCVATIGFSRYSGLSMLILLLSLGLLGEFARQGGLSMEHVRSSLGQENSGVWFLAPVCVFGFALCPYLDYTFHRARQQAPGASGRVAFTLGFGLFFLMMILFTLAYAWVFTARSRSEQWSRAEPLVSMHIIAQITFTIMAHTLGYLTERSAKRSKRSAFSAGRFVGAMAIGLVFFGGPLLAVFVFDNRTHAGMTVAEIIYRCFMSFYGLVFPAYVWLCMIPTADGHSGIEGERGRRKLIVLGVACALAAPCYWMGFIERVEWWLAPGLGIVLVARLLVRGSRAAAEADQSRGSGLGG